MRLTSQEEYGMRCLVSVAKRQPEFVSIRQVAGEEGLSVEYAGKLLQCLRKNGFIIAKRGSQGGYCLAKPAAEITAQQVLRALDGPLFDERFCAQHTGQHSQCVHQVSCQMRGMFQAMSNAAFSVASDFTLEQLIPPEVSS